MKPTHVLVAWLVAAVGAAPAHQGVDVEKTVAQVEQLLRQHSQLPRLSRDDILQLLSDIRAEDDRSNREQLFSQQQLSEGAHSNSHQYVGKERERLEFNEIDDGDRTDLDRQASSPTTTRPLMVVLPYTPRDGSTLQELYTRPPRVALVQAPAPMRAPDSDGQASAELPQTVQPLAKRKPQLPKQVAEKISEKVQPLPSVPTTRETIFVNPGKPKDGSRINATAPVPPEYPDVSADLRDFLAQHGLTGNNGAPQDHFLLPVDGFRPLPPIRDVDGSVDLPEKILLTYDLASPPTEDLYDGTVYGHLNPVDLPPTLQVYGNYDVDYLPSNKHETVVPPEVPNRIRKAVEERAPFSPVEYEDVQVIPLNAGPDPLTSSSASQVADVQKRQSDNSTEDANTAAPSFEPSSTQDIADVSSVATTAPESITDSTKSESVDSSSAADTAADGGASVADLADSFGAPAPADESEAQLPPPRKNGFYWMLDWNSFLEVGDGDEKVNIRFEPKLGDPQMFLPVMVP